MTQQLFSVWQGVFKNFEEAGGDLDAFDSDIWITKQKKKIYKHLENIKKNASYTKDYPLPIIVSMLLSIKKQLTVLDFGGGMGAQYLEIIAKVPDSKKRITYLVVDGKKSIQSRPIELNTYKNLKFYDNYSQIKSRKIDIVHIGSTLQYIEYWENILQDFENNFQPEYFVFSDLLAGDIPIFITHQIFYGKKIPHLFLNWKKFKGFMESSLQFQLTFKTQFKHNILDQDNIFPNFDLPKTHQIDRALNAVFRRL
jgi:putative methyltransferase (TIGR04325 family)